MRRVNPGTTPRAELVELLMAACFFVQVNSVMSGLRLCAGDGAVRAVLVPRPSPPTLPQPHDTWGSDRWWDERHAQAAGYWNNEPYPNPTMGMGPTYAQPTADTPETMQQPPPYTFQETAIFFDSEPRLSELAITDPLSISQWAETVANYAEHERTSPESLHSQHEPAPTSPVRLCSKDVIPEPSPQFKHQLSSYVPPTQTELLWRGPNQTVLSHPPAEKAGKQGT